MLKLTKKTEYALMALRYLSNLKEGEKASAKEISDTCQIPYPLLAKVLQELSKKRFLEPVQGARGGYILIKPLNKISMTELFESLEGPLGIMDCFLEEECEIIDSCSIRTPIQRINRSLRNLFDDMTVLDVTN
ncbi:MAG: Rrf2 family transcriptional regulator [Candidatus Marinimicrobia bacterium]|jgi:Rrf2 family protein|nr:BadM/Rrf2 family transcriptional regulator [Candidatus Neomarinimicrobiota bacterium]MDP6456666.1 Rrf2 family transcriptional regulator [Candidatus Neomarinimicrobiota bacterium]MDP6593086.1 Rrf2 family transcriptional regulator [Candidatus Neomarinimicrobiota bacterium]MDP6836399.1 Rrf2 family transcriptional regulator [Candidatus Neomarinimicrobiota bacterium]MDP6966394.1 Rrf2 family transcriptional regulator [Candidatus Neomarinimicrobiota bacterium]|tara:strand:- start:412 stop:810 length:399 start_codon:yes stop_codon:yes gene_type:complete